tara:strand:- start:2493 stop:2924 length:432 start_codon:yes stop_codon:yes gene_type:complete
MAKNTKIIRPFHLAFPVSNLDRSKKWYTEILGCSIGRASDEWIDFNLYGHQIVAHLSNENYIENTNIVDNNNIPVRHFGVILEINEWTKLVEKIKQHKIDFLIKPQIRFKNKKGEQRTFFIKDPDDNALEFKAFNNDSNIFEN